MLIQKCIYVSDINIGISAHRHPFAITMVPCGLLHSRCHLQPPPLQVGVTLNIHWAEPEDPSDPTHLEAAETILQFSLGWFAQPILVDGKYPEVIIRLLTNYVSGRRGGFQNADNG